jgi:multicomponent Na+:H+ antiporter subunit A
VAKELAYGAFSHGSAGGIPNAWLVLVGIVAGSVLSVAYSARFVWGAFVAAGVRARAGDESADVPAAPAPSAWFVAPVALLAGVTLLLGIVPGAIDGLVVAATHALDPAGDVGHLALWHGWNLALALSVLTLALGICLFVARTPAERVLALGARVPSSSDAYLAVLSGLNRGADAVTGFVQRGSLPVYLGVILLTASLLPGWALLRGGWSGWPQVVDTRAHLPVAVLLVGAGIAAAAARSRLQAALFLGLTGYAMAGFFIIQGAPDLALTQVAVETLSTVLFVLALRRLPDRFGGLVADRSRAIRAGVALTVGVVVFLFAIVAADSRNPDPVSEEMIERSLPDGHGRNVVNVILVDFRGIDTLGEITVLAVASIGAVALARAGRRRPQRRGVDS